MLLIAVLVLSITLSRHQIDGAEDKTKKTATIKLPNLGVGLLDIKTDIERENALVLALDSGYRMIDIWEGDEIPVREAIARSKIPRKEIFIVVKLNPPETANQIYNTGEAVNEILERLQTDYIDLLLINYADINDQHVQRWKAMISLKNRNKVKLIGVSNFNYKQVKSLGKATAVLPSVVQLEINPFFQQVDLVKNLTSHGIVIQAYSPLANGQKLKDPRVMKIAQKYDATTASLLIQWCLQKGFSCVTKSTNKEHLDDNINLGEFHIEDVDMKELEGLEERFVTNYDPDDPQFYEKSYYQAKETEHEPKEGQLGDNGNTSEEEPYYFDGNNDENGEDYVADESPTTSGRPPKQNGSKGQEKEPNKTHEDVVADTVVIDRASSHRNEDEKPHDEF